jgi:hypothetical protein
VRFYMKTEVSDDSDSDSSGSSVEAPRKPQNKPIARALDTDRALSASVLTRHARARVGTESLARQVRSASTQPVIEGSSVSASSHQDELSLSIAPTGVAAVTSSPLPVTQDTSTLTGIMALSDRGMHFPWVAGELLGHGTSGHVYKAMRRDTGEMIAMKVQLFSSWTVRWCPCNWWLCRCLKLPLLGRKPRS